MNLFSDKSISVGLLLLYILGIAWLFYNFNESSGIIVCPSKLIYNIPCPGCGMTRACILAMHGDFLGAIIMNPNSLIMLPVLVLFPFVVLIGVFSKKYNLVYFYRLYEKICSKKAFYIPFLIVEVIIWIYLLVKEFY